MTIGQVEIELRHSGGVGQILNMPEGLCIPSGHQEGLKDMAREWHNGLLPLHQTRISREKLIDVWMRSQRFVRTKANQRSVHAS